jgi:hypothetical protein
MRKFFIKFGYLSKKLLFPFLFAFSQIFFDLYTNNIIEEDKNQIFQAISISLGQMKILIIPSTKFFSDKNENKNIKQARLMRYLILHIHLDYNQ